MASSWGAGLIFIVWSVVFDEQFESLTGTARSDQYGRLGLVAIDLLIVGVFTMAAFYQPRRTPALWVAIAIGV